MSYLLIDTYESISQTTIIIEKVKALNIETNN